MPQMKLDVSDAGELAEMLEFISQWLGSDPGLEVSFGRWIGHPGYGIAQLRQDLDRFTFLLGGHDGEHWLNPRGEENHGQLTPSRSEPGSRGHGRGGTPGFDRGPLAGGRQRPKGRSGSKTRARRQHRLRPPAPCQADRPQGRARKS